MRTFGGVNGQSFAGSVEVIAIDVEASEFFDLHSLGGDGGGADSGEGVEEVVGSFEPVNADALLDEGDRKGRGVGAFFAAGLNGVVGDEPIVSAAAFVLASGVAPAGDV